MVMETFEEDHRRAAAITGNLVAGSAVKTDTKKLQNESLQREKKVPYLPPCRVCDSVASGFHYGMLTILRMRALPLSLLC